MFSETSGTGHSLFPRKEALYKASLSGSSTDMFQKNEKDFWASSGDPQQAKKP
jgi:hypothetical protein